MQYQICAVVFFSLVLVHPNLKSWQYQAKTCDLKPWLNRCRHSNLSHALKMWFYLISHTRSAPRHSQSVDCECSGTGTDDPLVYRSTVFYFPLDKYSGSLQKPRNKGRVRTENGERSEQPTVASGCVRPEPRGTHSGQCSVYLYELRSNTDCVLECLVLWNYFAAVIWILWRTADWLQVPDGSCGTLPPRSQPRRTCILLISEISFKFVSFGEKKKERMLLHLQM